jgi:hypothetical protein
LITMTCTPIAVFILSQTMDQSVPQVPTPRMPVSLDLQVEIV